MKLPRFLFLIGVIFLCVGCVSEDTSPSSALFPTTAQYTSTSIGSSVALEEVRRDYTDLLQTNAPRRKVELTALLGDNYISSRHNSSTWSDLKSGSCQLADGKQGYRVRDIYPVSYTHLTLPTKRIV